VEILGKKLTERITLCEVHSFATSPNSCQRTTVLNADVPNYLLVLVVDERGSFSAVGAHIFPSFIKTVLEDVD